METTVIAEFCKCGAGMEGTLEASPEEAQKAIDAFWQVHSTPDCGRTTRSRAALMEKLTR